MKIRPLIRRATPLLAALPLALFADAPADGFVALFDGKTLAGWEKYGGIADYEVTDGTIVGTSRPNTPNTFLCTEKEYGDFVFTYDYFPHPTLNCGVQFRSQIRAKGDRVFGYQCEIDPSDRAWSAGVYEEASRGWLFPLVDPKAKAAFKPGVWNTVRIVCVGPSVRTWLNGIPVADMVDDGHRKGIIGLQVHGVGDNKTPMQIKWRNLRIKELAPTNTSALIDDPNPTLGKAAPRGADVALSADTGLDAWQLRPNKVPWMSAYEPGNLQWTLTPEGVATPKPKAGSMDTKKLYGAQRIHVEFRTPPSAEGDRPEVGGNSGVYLQGRYELQICNSAGLPPADNQCGGLYKRRAPDVNAAKKPGEWQTYDIVFLPARFDDAGTKIAHARLSAKLNGQWIHHDIEIPGSTGSGNKESASAGPLRLQEHQKLVDFRNVWVADLDNPSRLDKFDPRKKK